MPVVVGLAHRILIQFDPPQFHCSCTGRRGPCLHALALAGWYHRAGAEAFPLADQLPEWASAQAKAGRAAAVLPGDDSATERRAQRLFERLERAADGLSDLENWLEDLARRGLATTLGENAAPFAHIATRMADASLPGLARLFRNLDADESPDLTDRAADALGSCYLAIRSFQKRELLPPALVFDLQSFLGISLKKEEALQGGARVADTWTVLGRFEAPLEERLWQRRLWLRGASGQVALLLDFAFGDTAFAPGLPPGTNWQGTLIFYPSNFPQRAIPPEELHAWTGPAPEIAAYDRLDDMAAAYAEALGRQPWLNWFPAVLDLIPMPNLQALDREHKAVSLCLSENANWKLVAVAGGRPLRLFGEWDGRAFRPLAFWENSQIYRTLQSYI
jgi:hypothetical protein